MDLNIKDKIALITGSTQGIGFASAKLLAAEGATVVLNGRSQKSVAEAEQKLRQELPEAKIKGIACDFSQKNEVADLLDSIPQVDILVNNVGISEPTDFNDIDDDKWLFTYQVNVMSGVRLARAYLPKMLEDNSGRIIFVSSESGINVPGQMIHYGVSKSAQISLSRGLAELTEGTHVTVNSVLPGPTYTERLKNLTDKEMGSDMDRSEKEQKFFASNKPTSIIKRFADPNEVANLIAYVASPLSGATNGTALRVEGGIINSMY